MADEYVRRIADELQHKPLDRLLLDDFAAALRGRGPVCDLGCGPGHVAGYLHQRGVAAFGLDLSPELVNRARRLNPDIDFRVGDLTELDAADGAWAGIAAFYSLIHVTPEEMPSTLRGLHRVLQPGGLLLVAFHLGTETIHLDDWWDQPVDIDFHFFQAADLARDLEAAGFVVEKITERDPYPGVEHPSRRGYVRARREK